MVIKVLAAIAGVAILIALIVGLAVGGWKLYWAANTSATNHNAIIFQHSYGTQSAYIEELQNQITQIDTIQVQITDPSTPAAEHAALQAQKAALVNQACTIFGNIDVTMPRDEAQFGASNCN